jgi:hypothetical protein
MSSNRNTYNMMVLSWDDIKAVHFFKNLTYVLSVSICVNWEFAASSLDEDLTNLDIRFPQITNRSINQYKNH